MLHRDDDNATVYVCTDYDMPHCSVDIDAPAYCMRCLLVAVAPTTGKVSNRCTCGGRRVTIQPVQQGESNG